MAVRSQPKPLWSKLEKPGCNRVEFRVLSAGEGIALANLKFLTHAHIDRHSAPYEIDVMCMAGSGFVLIGEDTFSLTAGQTVRWTAEVMHCLWTEDSHMETLMLERYGEVDGNA